MSTYTFARGYVDVSIGHETISVDAYNKHTGDAMRRRRYSGYTLSETVCAALIELGIAADWVEAIELIERAGIPYESSDDE